MKQVLLKKGDVTVEEVPAPIIKSNNILVQVAYSCISTGTEISGVTSSGQSLLQKALKDPHKVKKALNLAKTQGISNTIARVKAKFDSASRLGYSCAGKVIDRGKNIKDVEIEDKVACAGAEYANHAEIVCVPQNLVVKVPHSLDLKDAASVTLGAIAMQGLRRAEVRLGENIAVIGLGLLGQILAQLLRANGARVIGFDLNDEKVNLAKALGMNEGYNSSKNNALEKVLNFTEDKGVDATIISASARGNNEIIQEAMEITRKKGRVVVVGDIGLGPKRSPFYEKEIDYLISTSYGPGRYDKDYEEKGIDYPFSYVRWTEKRNMEEYLRLLSEGKMNFQKLISKIFPLEKTPEAYKFLEENRPANPVVLLNYHFRENEKPEKTKIVISRPFTPHRSASTKLNVGAIGAGGFARAIHLPNLKKLSNLYSILAICDIDSPNAKNTAQKFKAKYCTTDYEDILKDENIDPVMITLPHNLHSKVAIEAARAGKAVFCEKPMALNEKELNELVKTLKETKVPYLVGFNRRFSPFAKKIKKLIQKRENPIIIDYQMNAGYLPKDHWTQTEVGGGRNIGEACHIYDLFTFFTESEVEKINAFSITPRNRKYLKNDNFIASLKFKDSSICNLVYTAMGTKDYPKEQMKIYFEGKVIFLDDYKNLRAFGLKNFSSFPIPHSPFPKTQDKGHLNEIQEFGESIKNGSGYPIPLWQLIQATKISFEVEKQISFSE